MLAFVFVSEDFDMNTMAYMYLFCEDSFFSRFFLELAERNWVLSQPILYYTCILPTCSVRNV